MAVPLKIRLNRLCVAAQGGYFFMFLMTSHNAINKMINNTNSAINIPPLLKGVRTTAAVPYYDTYYIIIYERMQVYNMNEF